MSQAKLAFLQGTQAELTFDFPPTRRVPVRCVEEEVRSGGDRPSEPEEEEVLDILVRDLSIGSPIGSIFGRSVNGR